jgi:hypothetical protein
MQLPRKQTDSSILYSGEEMEVDPVLSRKNKFGERRMKIKKREKALRKKNLHQKRNCLFRRRKIDSRISSMTA